MNPWDRQPAEPTDWFSRFEAYRLAGPGRTLSAVYDAAQKSPKKPGQVSGAWKDAAEKWRWHERAEAWDMHLIERRRADDEIAYRKQLERHRDNALKLGQVSLNNAVRILALLDTRLQGMEAKDIPLKQIAGLARAAAFVAEAALNGEAQALAVDELLRELDGKHGD